MGEAYIGGDNPNIADFSIFCYAQHLSLVRPQLATFRTEPGSDPYECAGDHKPTLCSLASSSPYMTLHPV